MTSSIHRVALVAIFIATTMHQGFSQFSLSGQLRTRAELRDGQGAPLPKGTSAAGFISQRSRINASFTTFRVKTHISIQDVRVWGQDVSTINRTTIQEQNGLMLHEAWADIILYDSSATKKKISLKLGRQELIYDDQRLIGNLDWLQQGRRHDAAVFKFESAPWKIHLGAAYNQNRENQSGSVYNSTPPGAYPATTNGGVMYKGMQFLYAGRTLKKGNASFLFFADQFSRFGTENIDSVITKKYVGGTWPRYTSGLFYLNAFGNLSVTGSLYYQFGKGPAGDKLNACMFTMGAFQQLGKFTAGGGFDFTSGGSVPGSNKSFDPLYGTPHKFWGGMDYFYAGSAFGRGGLADYYIRLKYQKSTRLSFGADFHYFQSAAKYNLPGINNKGLGEEIDLVASCPLNDEIGFEAGYSHFFSTPLLTSAPVKNVSNARHGANWAYVMINVKPQFLFK